MKPCFQGRAGSYQSVVYRARWIRGGLFCELTGEPVFAPGRGPRCVRRLDTRTWTPLPRISVRRFRGFTSGVPREILPGQWEAVEGASVSVDTKGQRKSKGDASSARRRAGKLPCGIERPRLRMQSTSPVPSYRQTLEWDHRRPGWQRPRFWICRHGQPERPQPTLRGW